MKKLLASLRCLLMLSAGAPRDIDYDAILFAFFHR